MKKKLLKKISLLEIQKYNALIFKDGNDLKELKKNLENKFTSPNKKILNL